MRRNEQIDTMLLASVLFLAERGLSARAIANATGLSTAQVFYRTGKFDMPLSSYRRGESEYARRVIQQTDCVKNNIRATRGVAYKVAM